MNCNQPSKVLLFGLLAILFWPVGALADYIGSNSSAPIRIRDNGSLASPTYDIPSGFPIVVESTAQEVALSADLTKIYGLANTLGFANQVQVWNVNAAPRIDTMFLDYPPSDRYIYTGAGLTQPLIVGNELIAATPIYNSNSTGLNANSWQVKRFDTNTDALLQTLSPPTPQRVDDVGVQQSGFFNYLYMATPSGVYQFPRINPIEQNYEVPPTLLVPGVDGNIAYGPDGLLYIRNFANGDVQRYSSLTGTFTNTFVSHTSFPNLGTIQFGSDGNLHAYQNGAAPMILKFSGATGVLLSSTPAGGMVNGRVFYLVPEPSGLLLLSLVMAAALDRRSRERGKP